jgi:hypothetical protein
MRALVRERRSTHFSCGHPRTPQNSYTLNHGQTTCRECACAKSRARYWADPEARRIASRKYARSRNGKGVVRKERNRHDLGYQLYYDLRRLMIEDGRWPTAEELRAHRNGAAA